MSCVNPPLLKKPSRGFAWACGPCSKAQEKRLEARNTPNTSDAAADAEDDDFPASNAYGISSVPSLFLIEADGRIGRVIEGWKRMEMEWLGSRSGAAVLQEGEKVPEWKPG